MGSKRLAKECVYCGSMENLTRDHVPGKGLFSKPLPSTLVTVPCCEKCNVAHELEDEYFRLHVASRKESRTHPEAAQAGDRAFARLVRLESTGFRQSVVDSMVTLDLISAEEDEGMLGTFMVDFSRLNSYAGRTIRALFAHHWRVRIPNGYQVVAFCADMPGFATQEGQARLNRFLSVIRSGRQYSSARQILRYRFASFMDDGVSSIWGLSFFSYTAFVGAVIPERSDV